MASGGPTKTQLDQQNAHIEARISKLLEEQNAKYEVRIAKLEEQNARNEVRIAQLEKETAPLRAKNAAHLAMEKELEQRKPGKEKIFDSWKDLVFIVEGDRAQGSGILMDKKRLATAAHLGFKLNQKYTVKGTNGRQFSAECSFIRAQDIAILKSDEFDESSRADSCSYSGSGFDCGKRNFILGYPHDSDKSRPSIVECTIHRVDKFSFNYFAKPGVQAGYSGGPIFSDFGSFCGILLGPTNRTTTEQSAIEQSSEETMVEMKAICVYMIGAMLAHREHTDNES